MDPPYLGSKAVARATLWAGAAGAVCVTARAAYRWYTAYRANGDLRGVDTSTRHGEGAAFASKVYGRALWGVVAAWAGVLSFRLVKYRPFIGVGVLALATHSMTGVGYAACWAAGVAAGPFVKNNPKGVTVVMLTTLVGHMAAVRSSDTPLGALLLCGPASMCYGTVCLPLAMGVPTFEALHEPLLQGQLLVSSLLSVHTWWCLERASPDALKDDRLATYHSFGIVGIGAYAAWTLVRLTLRAASFACSVFVDKNKREEFQRNVQPALDVLSGAGLTAGALAFAYARAKKTRYL